MTPTLKGGSTLRPFEGLCDFNTFNCQSCPLAPIASKSYNQVCLVGGQHLHCAFKSPQCWGPTVGWWLSFTGLTVQELGPSESIIGQQGPSEVSPRGRKHTAVKQRHTPFLPGQAELLHEELYFGACLGGEKIILLKQL